VSNLTQDDIKFCKRNCPLEGKFIKDYFEVKDEGGNKLEYVGESFQRMPPTDIEYINLGGMQKVVREIDLKKGYKIEKPGKYTIKFKGDKVNTLPDSEEITIEIQ
ncbi:MAG: hypothetical protein C0594_12120, partial [Marinilabiliales bacterium]